jgi:hypothetical protein
MMCASQWWCVHAVRASVAVTMCRENKFVHSHSANHNIKSSLAVQRAPSRSLHFFQRIITSIAAPRTFTMSIPRSALTLRAPHGYGTPFTSQHIHTHHAQRGESLER